MKKGNSTPGGVLVRLKNKLCLAMGIDSYRLRMLIDRTVTMSTDGRTTSRSHFDRVNMVSEFTKEEMTIKVLFKFLKILDPESVTLSLSVKTKTGLEFKVGDEIKFMSSDTEDLEAQETKEEAKQLELENRSKKK